MRKVVLVSFLGLLCVLQLECKLFIGSCSFKFCHQKCEQVAEEIIECLCEKGFILQNDGRRCIKSEHYEEIVASGDDEESGDGESKSTKNCDNEGGCEKGVEEGESSGEEETSKFISPSKTVTPGSFSKTDTIEIKTTPDRSIQQSISPSPSVSSVSVEHTDHMKILSSIKAMLLPGSTNILKSSEKLMPSKSVKVFPKSSTVAISLEIDKSSLTKPLRSTHVKSSILPTVSMVEMEKSLAIVPPLVKSTERPTTVESEEAFTTPMTTTLFSTDSVSTTTIRLPAVHTTNKASTTTRSSTEELIGVGDKHTTQILTTTEEESSVIDGVYTATTIPSTVPLETSTRSEIKNITSATATNQPKTALTTPTTTTMESVVDGRKTVEPVAVETTTTQLSTDKSTESPDTTIATKASTTEEAKQPPFVIIIETTSKPHETTEQSTTALTEAVKPVVGETTTTVYSQDTTIATTASTTKEAKQPPFVIIIETTSKPHETTEQPTTAIMEKVSTESGMVVPDLKTTLGPELSETTSSPKDTTTTKTASTKKPVVIIKTNTAAPTMTKTPGVATTKTTTKALTDKNTPGTSTTTTTKKSSDTSTKQPVAVIQTTTTIIKTDKEASGSSTATAVTTKKPVVTRKTTTTKASGSSTATAATTKKPVVTQKTTTTTTKMLIKTDTKIEPVKPTTKTDNEVIDVYFTATDIPTTEDNRVEVDNEIKVDGSDDQNTANKVNVAHDQKNSSGNTVQFNVFCMSLTLLLLYKYGEIW